MTRRSENTIGPELTPDWVDPEVVDRVIRGRTKPGRDLTDAEMVQVIVRMREEKKATDNEIAKLLGVGMARIPRLMRGPRLRGRR